MLIGSSQTTDDLDQDFVMQSSPAPSSPEPQLLDSSPGYTKAEALRLELFLDWRIIESDYLQPLRSEIHGWCRLVTLATNKNETNVPLLERRGYVQVSIKGFNKVSIGVFADVFFSLVSLVKVILHHRLAAIATTGAVPERGDDASHLCHRSTCSRVGHVIWESAAMNQSRKGCVVWVSCPHADCQLKIWVCEHAPRCIKTVPGVAENQVNNQPHLYFH